MSISRSDQDSSFIERRKRLASEQLLPLVYDELRRLAARKLADEKAGQTLQATALVHEAYLRLAPGGTPAWDGPGHFFAAAAEAMRRILVDRARRRRRRRHGGDLARISLDNVAEIGSVGEQDPEVLLALDEAVSRLEAFAPEKAKVVILRYFAGQTLEEVASTLDISVSTAKRHWIYARAWLFGELRQRTAQDEIRTGE